MSEILKIRLKEVEIDINFAYDAARLILSKEPEMVAVDEMYDYCEADFNFSVSRETEFGRFELDFDGTFCQTFFHNSEKLALQYVRDLGIDLWLDGEEIAFNESELKGKIRNLTYIN